MRHLSILISLAFLSACASSQQVIHPTLTSLQTESIEASLERVNRDRDQHLWFTGALQLGSVLYESYALASGPRLLMSIDAKSPTWAHSVCFEHPKTITRADQAGMKELGFELFRHRYGDPEDQLFEQLGGEKQSKEEEDWMCHGLRFSREVSLADVFASQSAAISNIDHERFRAARHDAVQKLRNQQVQIEDKLGAAVDHLLYDHLNETSDYAVPKLSRQAGLMALNNIDALPSLLSAYESRARLHILLDTKERDAALQLFAKQYEQLANEDEHDFPQTKTSTQEVAAWSMKQLQAEALLSKQPPTEITLKVKDRYFMFAWALPAQYHTDLVPLQAAALLLSEAPPLSSSMELVIEMRKYGGQFRLLIRGEDGESELEALAKIRARIALLSSDPKLKETLKPVRARMRALFWAQMDEPLKRSFELARASISGGDPSALAQELQAIKSLTRNQVVRVLSEYFVLRAPITVIASRVATKPKKLKRRNKQ